MVKAVLSCAAALLFGALALSLGGCGDKIVYSGPALPYTPEQPEHKEQTPPATVKAGPPQKPGFKIEPAPPAAQPGAEKPAEQKTEEKQP